MARSTKAKSPKSKSKRSRAQPKNLLTAASLAGIGDLETFDTIRGVYDRLAESRERPKAAKQARGRVAGAAGLMHAASGAPWITKARGELGQRDYPGPRHNPRVIEYLYTTSFQANNDETSWCSAFVNWCMLKAGQSGTNNAAARSWLTYGQALASPRPGCIVVLWRQSPSSWKGHVGFFEGFDVGNRVRLLGGNQGGGLDSDEVCVTTSRKSVLGYRWPR